MYDASQSEECEREKRLVVAALRLGMTDVILKEENLRIHAQYEDKKFLELVGRGVIVRAENETFEEAVL